MVSGQWCWRRPSFVRRVRSPSILDILGISSKMHGYYTYPYFFGTRPWNRNSWNSVLRVHLQTFRLQELAYILSWWRSIDGWAPKKTLLLSLILFLEIFPNLCFFLPLSWRANGNAVWPKKNRSTKFQMSKRKTGIYMKFSYKKFRGRCLSQTTGKNRKSWTQR